jgi:hypothetical protein
MMTAQLAMNISSTSAVMPGPEERHQASENSSDADHGEPSPG